MSALTPRVNYLNNRDLLAQIHLSKLSYCYFIDDKYSNYDAIINSLDEISDQLIEEVRIRRAAKLTQTQKNLMPKAKQQEAQIITPNDIQIEDIVWRLMTYDHIPLDPTRCKNPKIESDKHCKINFPPFKHFILRDEDIIEVGRSHWRDSFSNGLFCQDQGTINRRLASMFMTLVDRYGQRSNWRGYCCCESTTALTQRGWLDMDEINENDTILSYSDGQLKWSKIKSIYRGEFDGLMHKIDTRNMDTLITPGHKMVTERGLIPIEYVMPSDKLIFMGKSVDGAETTRYSDSFVELIGWIVTEGNYEFLGETGQIRRITIYQNDGQKADRIRNCLRELDYNFSEGRRGEKQICFAICRFDTKHILKELPTKNLNMDFILSLTNDQRELLIDTMVAGDGFINSRTGTRHFDQKCRETMDFFLALCTLSGYRTLCRHIKMKTYDKQSFMYMYRARILSEKTHDIVARATNFHGGLIKSQGVKIANKLTYPNQPTTPYKGRVWCPETEYGCFLARRNGTVYLTGNTYVSEMRGQALLQLSLVGLQFDEGRSENPFAYFTVVTANAFTRILNLEKRNQNIRDDILIMNGASPSITRQLDDQLQQKEMNAEEGEDHIPTQEIKPAVKKFAFGRRITSKL